VALIVGIDVPIQEMDLHDADEGGTENFRFDYTLPPGS